MFYKPIIKDKGIRMSSRFKLLLVILLTGLFVFSSSYNVIYADDYFCNWIDGITYGPNVGSYGYVQFPPFDIGDTLTITHTGTAAQVNIEAPSHTVVATIPQGGSVTFTITATGVTSLYIRSVNGLGNVNGSITCTGNPSSAPNDPGNPNVEVLFTPGDGRINHHVADRAAPAAVYCQYEGVQIIRIDPVTAEGTDEIRLSAEAIEAAGVPAEGNILLAQTDWAIVARLADGRFSLNTWYADGKPYTMTWANCDDSDNRYLER
jgi:hypothetical protein